MQVDGMTTTNDSSRHPNLHSGISGKGINTPSRHEFVRTSSTTQNLQEHWEGRRLEANVVNKELASEIILGENVIEGDVAIMLKGHLHV